MAASGPISREMVCVPFNRLMSKFGIGNINFFGIVRMSTIFWHVLTNSWGWVWKSHMNALVLIGMYLGSGSHYQGMAEAEQPAGSKEGRRLLESTSFATGSARGRQMEGNAMCHKQLTQFFTAVQLGEGRQK